MGEATTASRGFAAARWARVTRLPISWRSWLSVRGHVAGLILAIIGPLLAFSAFLVLRSAGHEQDVIAAGVRQRTREAAASIDHELGVLRTRLFILSGSHYLRSGDFAAFRDQAIEAVQPYGLAVVLSDLSGQQLVNTRAEPGQALPRSLDLDGIGHVAATGMPYVSSLVRSPLTGQFFLALSVPVMGRGAVTHVLSLDVAPMLPRMIADLNLPPDWLVAISDRVGRTIARSREPERFVGQMGRPEVIDRFREADEGWAPLVSREGIPIYNAFARAKFSDWVIAVGIPDAVLFAPVRRSTWILMLAGGITLTLALLLGMLIGRRLAGAIKMLVDNARRVGQGERIALAPTGIRETDSVARSLSLASERLQQSAHEREVLLHRTVTAQEAERKRIARELHDSLGQYLTALRLGFRAVEPVCASTPAAQQRLTQLKNLTDDLGRELSRIAWELRPLALDDLGLRGAVTQYLEEWAERSRLQIDLEIKLGECRLPQPVETALFRVLQEAITNVLKHSGAASVSVVLQATDDEVTLIVEDDGRGFDLTGNTPGQQFGTNRLGLLGLRERLALVGGSLEMESSHETGTAIYVRIPL